MDVIFHLKSGRAFTIEVGYWDTVLEIKEKIQKHQQIPISAQTLVYNGNVLLDDGNVGKCLILHNSHMRLILDSDSDEIQVDLMTPTTLTVYKVKISDTVLRMKQRIQEMEGKAVQKLVIRETGEELQDQKLIRDCAVYDNSEIDVTFIELPPNLAVAGRRRGGGSSSARKLKLMVWIKKGTEVAVEMNASDKVVELRKYLDGFPDTVQLGLPSRYFFIHNQAVMEEDRSFRWHQVADGDTIDVFPGFVTAAVEPQKKRQSRGQNA